MKPRILFVDMNESLLPLVKSIADRGFVPILMGPIAERAKSAGIPCNAFEEFSPADIQVRSLREAQRIAEELPVVIKDPAVQEAFGSSMGSFLPYTGRGFFEKLMQLIVHEAAAALTFERLVENCNLALIVFRTENDPVQRILIRQAQKHHVGTLQIAHAIFTKTLAKVAGEYERALRSDYIAVFGERASRFLEDIGCERRRIYISGSPYWDRLYLPDARIDMLEARKRLQLDLDMPVVLFGTSYPLASSAFYPSWAKQLALSHLSLIHAIKEMNSPVQLILRPHPWELGRVGLSASQERELLETYKSWLRNQGLTNVLISRDRKIEAIRAADVVLTGAMTSLIAEAMILERPVVVCPLEINFAYQPYTESDGIVVVEDQTQLPEILKTLLADPSQRQEIVQRQRNAVENINYGNDGKALARLHEIILQLASKALLSGSGNITAPPEEGSCSGGKPTNEIDAQCSYQDQGENYMTNTQNSNGITIHQPGKLSKGAVLDVGLKCTHSCGFCYYSYLDKSDDQFKGMRRANFRTLEECKEILRLLKRNGFVNFDYTGGEATLHPDIIEITRYAHQEIGLKGRMITLGQFLMQKMKNCQHDLLIEDLLEAGLTNFLLSVHAVDSELFQKITGESYDKLHRAMRYLDDKEFHYTTNTVVFEWNYQHLPQIAKQLTEHNVYLHNFIIMNAYYEWNKDGRAFGVQAKYSDIYPYLKEAVDILESHNVGVNIRYAPLCTVKGMEKNLVGMVGVRYDPYEWMNAAGHFGGTPEQCAAVYPLKDGEIEQHLTYRTLNGQLESGAKITGARGQVKYFTGACEGCQAREACDGIDGNYLKLYGGDEFSPYAEREEAPLQKARYGYTIPFMVKMSQYADMKGQVAGEFNRIRALTSGQPQAPSAVELIQIESCKGGGGHSIPSDHVSASITQGNLAAPTEESRLPLPRVSVVVVSYNYGRYLAEAVQSVLTQTFRDFEVIIVNDGSTDNTAEVAESLAKASPNARITVINQANAGQPAISRNNGIAQAKGDYILCLDADDKIAPTMLEQCVQMLDQDSSIGIVYTDRLDFDGVDQVVQAGDYNFSRLRYANHISYCALFRRNIWTDIGGYRTNVKGCEDWDFWVAAGARGYLGRRIPQALFLYRRHDTGVYQEALAHLQERAVQIVLNNREAYTQSDIETATAFLASRSQDQNSNHASPLVSVIIPTYNRPERLVEAIRSVLSQTYQNIEILVINDGGREVETFVSPLDQSGRVKYIRLSKNQERSHARNIGLQMARGKYIAYLDDDDRFYSNHVQTLVTFLERSGALVAYTDAHRVLEVKGQGQYVRKGQDVPYSVDFNHDSILSQNYVPMLCLMHAKSCIEQVGGFDETLSTHEDWELVIRLSRCFSIHHIKSVTAEFTWRTDGTSTTSQRPDDFVKTRQLIHEKYKEYRSHDDKVASVECQITHENASHSYPYDCSIVIPVFNKADLTKQCLTQLANVTDGVNYEVIIVDNHSTDETPAFLAMLGGDIQVIRNQENLGFAKACNQGARTAKGKELVFLNNDTIPQPGWLSSLIEEANSCDEIAVVGSKLLYPDNRLQHAGVAFSRELTTPYHIYRGRPNDGQLGNRRRELQAVTAACMLVKRKWFDDVEGFNEDYKNGFEDVDLCLKVGERGGKIIYQPKSWLYHLESQSPGRHKHEERNAALFLEKWGEKYLIDEDRIAFEDGIALVSKQEDGLTGYRYMIIEARDYASWERVSKLQRFLQQLELSQIGKQETEALSNDIRLLVHCPEEWPRDVAVAEWVGMVCHSLGFYKESERFFRQALQEGESFKARKALARLAINRENLQEANIHLKVLLDSCPSDAAVWHIQGVYLIQCKKFSDAVNAFERVIKHDGDQKNAQLGMGMAYIGMGNARQAWDVFTKASNENPDDVDVMNWLIRTGTELADWNALVKRLIKFVERNPANCDMRFALTGVLFRHGNLDDAQGHLNTLKLLQPDFVGLEELQNAILGVDTHSVNIAS